MKHYFLLLCCLFGLLLSACDKMPTDSDLNGRWQLTAIGDQAVSEPVFWSFQLDLLSINTTQSIHNGATSETVGRFTESEGRLALTALYIHYRDRDEPVNHVNTPNPLEKVGILGTQPTYLIETLDASTLILVDEAFPSQRLTFRKIK